MADVFLSYASADRERARELAEVLSDRGFTTWWDRTIQPGRAFDEVIQEELAAARCVIVLWSQASAGSNWVKLEASEAASRHVLVPASIEAVPIPFEFRRLQAANLADWTGERDHPELETLLSAVATVVAAPNRTNASPAARPAAPRRRRWLSLPVAIAIVFALALVSAGALMLRRQLNAASGAGTTDSVTGSIRPARTEPPPASPPTRAPAPAAAPAAAAEADPTPKPKGTNLLALENGGEVLVGNSPDWPKVNDGDDTTWFYTALGGEVVFGFKDGKAATFDTFAMLIPKTDTDNVKGFELSGGNAAPTGPFQSIGSFETQNVRLFKTPYQEFHFPPVTAKYLKLKVVSTYGYPNAAVYELQLRGTPGG
jgi:hypothetical protein